MWNKLEQVFNQLGLPYFRQGSILDPETLPTQFFTFWNINTEDDLFCDDVPGGVFTIWKWQVYYYTQNAADLYNGLDTFRQAALANGFIVTDKGQDIPSNTNNYFSRTITIQYIDN